MNGESESEPVSVPLILPSVSNGFQICSIVLSDSDTLILVGVPESLFDGLRAAITTGWLPKTIKSEKIQPSGTYKFRLVGNPWRGNGEEAVMSRKLIGSVLGFMAVHGWSLLQSGDVSKKKFDKDTLFFCLEEPDPDALIFSISFTERDKIRVIGNECAYPFIRAAVESVWKLGIAKEKDYAGSLELRLNGTPWWSYGEQSIETRILLNQILANLRAAGYKLYGSIDQSIGQGEHSVDLESWYFRKITSIWR